MGYTPTAEFSPAQFAEALRRMLWGLRRLRRKLDDWLTHGPETVPAGQLREALQLIARSVEAKDKIERAATYAETVLGDWESMIDGALPTYAKVYANVNRIAARVEGPALLRALVVGLRLALEAGHDALEAQTDWAMLRAQEQLDFWTRMKELAELPGDAFAAIVRGAASVARAATEGGLGALFKALQPLIPYIALFGGGLIALRSLNRGNA